jgi:membrane peptidoglycan carboxypeptidase
MRRAAARGSRHDRRADRPDPRAAAPRRSRWLDYPRAGRRGVRRWLPSWKQVLGTFVVGLGSLIGVIGYAYASVQIPNANPQTALQNNVYYWSDGSVMASQGAVNRQNVTLDKVPLAVQWDFLAAENASFYTDSGIDPQGIARAMLNMVKGGAVQSGSTITQQFVKNTYLDQSQTLSRKFKELLISVKIGSRMSKQQILQGYLNTCYFGRGTNGIEAAARAYYGKDVSQLDVSQGAFLAAAVNEPSLYQNADDPKVAQATKARWSWILDRMVTIGKLSQAERNRYTTFPIPRHQTPGKGMSGQIGYLVQTAQDYVTTHDSAITAKDLSLGGYQIHTTFDRKKTDELAAAVKSVRSRNLDPKHRAVDNNVQIGAASVVPDDGAIVALYGGDNYVGHYTDNANTTGVPVGSTFKPFVLAAALQYGATLTPGQPAAPITPDSRFNGDDLITIKNPDGTNVLNPDGSPFRQKNETNYPWGFITLRKAMEQSVNSPFVQLGEYTGLQHVAGTATRAGLLSNSLASLNASFSIGTSTPSAIRMADAYATFAASGVHADPYSVTRVLHNGQELSGFAKPATSQAMPAAVADNVTGVLKDVIAKGTATQARSLGRTAAGKTGTTDQNKSAWFVGYTRQLATSVVLFREKDGDPTLLSMNGVGGQASVFGGTLPTEVWTTYMTQALQGAPDLPFPTPGALTGGSNEPGAPNTASPTVTAPPSPTATATGGPPSQSAPPSPSPSTTGCTGLFGCGSGGAGGGSPSPTPTPSSSSTSGPPGLLGPPKGG